MERTEFRKRLEAIRAIIDTALELDGQAPIHPPVPGLPAMRSRDLGDSADQATIMFDLRQAVDKLTDAVLTEGRHDGNGDSS